MTFVAVLALALATVALAVAGVALRSTRALSRSTAAAAAHVVDDVDWQLQWIEPGVYFLANTSPGTAALQVEVSSSLTPVVGGAGTTAKAHAPRVNPGSWVEVRHPSVGQGMFDDLAQLRRSTAVAEELRRRSAPLDTVELAALGAADELVYTLQDRVEHTLSYSVSWQTDDGDARLKAPLEQRLVPSPAVV